MTIGVYPPISPTMIDVADSPILDGFQNFRVSTENTLFDSQQEYGLDTIHLWSITANGTLPTILETNGSVSSGGNSVGPRNTNSRMTPVTVSSTNGHYAILQSQQYVRYIPGHAHKIEITGVFAAGSSYTASFVLRSAVTGSVVDTSVSQSSWNVDKFDGTGVSGITLDLTQIQILVIDAQMLYAGRIRAGFSIDGRIYWAHYFEIANNQTLATVQTFNLPIRVKGETGASSTTFRFGYGDESNGVFLSTVRSSTGGTVNFECCSVKSSGGTEQRGFQSAQSGGITTIAVTTRRPIFSIRPRALFNALNNRGHIEPSSFMVRATTNDAYIEIIRGGTLTGASWIPTGPTIASGSFVVGVRYVIASIGTTDFTLIGASANTVGLSFVATGVGAGTGAAVLENTITEYDTSATAIVGGERIDDVFAVAAFGASSDSTIGMIDLRNPLVLNKIESLTATQTPLTIVATSFTGTSNVVGGFTWFRQVI